MSIARLMQQAAAGSAGAGPEPSGWTDPDLANASYDSVSFSVAGQETGPRALVFNSNGTKMYLVGTTTDAVYQYTLSSAFDLSTASYDSVSFSVAGQDTGPTGLAFSDDGTKMYVCGYQNDSVYQYTLSSAFDLSTASYDTVSFSVAGQDANPFSIVFNPNGTKMFMVGVSTDTVYQYSLSLAWDLSSASYDSVSLAVSGQDATPFSAKFNPDGTKMFLVGNANDSVFQYTLSTGFDLTTASYDSVSFSVSPQDATPADVAFNGAGSKMYLVGFATQAIYQYSTA
jgi:6-phosphogluconolactonase (cycloisomerase 2 family)